MPEHHCPQASKLITLDFGKLRRDLLYIPIPQDIPFRSPPATTFPGSDFSRWMDSAFSQKRIQKGLSTSRFFHTAFTSLSPTKPVICRTKSSSKLRNSPFFLI